MRMSSIEKIRDVIDYDPSTGEFTWKVLRGGCKRRVAGYSKNGDYSIISVRGVRWKSHRLAWFHFYGEMPPPLIDHIDGNKSNNRISNLRAATKAENCRNKRIHANNTSGYKGVSWHKATGKWMASIMTNGKTVHLGVFSDPTEAHEAYTQAARDMHGEFARTA